METAQVPFFPTDIPECELPDRFCSFFQEKTTAIRSELDSSELDSQPADSTPTLHSFVGSELCGFEPVSQELVRKLIRDSAPKSLDANSLKKIQTCVKPAISLQTAGEGCAASASHPVVDQRSL